MWRRKNMHAAHFNGDSGDNRIENLYWATPAQNNADIARHGNVKKGKDHPRYKHGRYVKDSMSESSK
jgi:hypothetical protein